MIPDHPLAVQRRNKLKQKNKNKPLPGQQKITNFVRLLGNEDTTPEVSNDEDFEDIPPPRPFTGLKPFPVVRNISDFDTTDVDNGNNSDNDIDQSELEILAPTQTSQRSRSRRSKKRDKEELDD